MATPLTPDQARDLRTKLEQDINRLIKEFQTQTGAEIESIHAFDPHVVGGRYTIVSIKACIRL